MSGIINGYNGYYPVPGSFAPPHSEEASDPIPAPAPVTRPSCGDPAGQACYAEQLERGIGVEKNVGEAFRWYTKAADAGHNKAVLALADLYLQGFGGDVGLSTKIRHLKAAGELEHATALNRLGEIYEGRKDLSTRVCTVTRSVLLEEIRNLPNPRNWSKALECYARAADLGCLDAYANLGRCFHEGKGTDKDEATALTWATQAAAGGCAEGLYRVGLIHLQSEEEFADLNQAIFHLEEAAQLDHAPAQGELAWIYSQSGIQPNPDLAFKWALKSAQGGYPPGIRCLGHFYETGFGTAVNHLWAFEQYRAAAELGDSNAMWKLGWMYYTAKGTPVDHKKAYHWFYKAAKRGNPQAQYSVGMFQRVGLGGAPDSEFIWGSRWLNRAKKQGVTHIPGFWEASGLDRAPKQGVWDFPGF